MKKEHKEKPLIFKALEFFINNPYKEIYLREFSRKLKISPNTSQRFLNMFLKEELVIDKREANLRYFKANLENVVFRFLKKTYSVSKIKSSGLINYLKPKFSNIILFGSMAKGEDDLKSDIDIVCVGKKQKLDLYEYSKKLNKEINIYVFNFSEWRKQKKENRAFYEDVVSSGISLEGEMII